MKSLLASSIILLFLGCSTAHLEETEVILTQTNEEITLTNIGDYPVSFILMETNTAARTYLIHQCREFNPNLAPNSTETIPINEIDGYSEEAESFYFSWNDCTTAGNSQTIKFDP